MNLIWSVRRGGGGGEEGKHGNSVSQHAPLVRYQIPLEEIETDRSNSRQSSCLVIAVMSLLIDSALIAIDFPPHELESVNLVITPTNDWIDTF